MSPLPATTEVTRPANELRARPRSSPGERLVAGVLALLCCLVIGTAYKLEPAEAGFGTHEQLGLAPCGFVVISERSFGRPFPCPSCGMTTSWSHAAKGQVLSAILAQPLGFVLFCAAVTMAVWGAVCAFTARPLLALLDRLPAGGSVIFVLSLGMVSWIYKIIIMGPRGP